MRTRIPTNDRPSKYETVLGNGVDNSFIVTHGLGTRKVIVQVRDSDGHVNDLCGKKIIDANTVKISFGATPTADQWIVVII